MNEERYAKYEAFVNECTRITNENKARIKEKYNECVRWIENNLINAGIVWTYHEEDMKQNRFYVWLDNGSITHKTITFAEAGINKISLLEYPIREEYGL